MDNRKIERQMIEKILCLVNVADVHATAEINNRFDDAEKAKAWLIV